jgi:RimJ/RimL family protein N-acetyltransferase
MNVTYREGTKDDADAVLAYLETISGESEYLSFGPGEFDKTLEEERDFLEAASTADNQLYVIATIGDRIVGSLFFGTGLRPRLRHTGDFGVSVLKECWGQGIGCELIGKMIDWARASEFVRKINLRVRADNQRAIDLYARNGFVHEGTITRDMLIDGKFYDFHCMGLEID